MAIKQIMVVDPSINEPEIAAINNIAQRSPLRISIHFPALYEDQTISLSKQNTAGMIIMGSQASVHNKLPWQQTLQDLILDMDKVSIPVLGLCYGHQILAHVYGGKVAYLWDGEKKRGVTEVNIAAHSLWGAARSGTLAYSHMEGVVDCPPGFEVVASSAMTAIEGIAGQNKPIWGFQPHLEATQGFLKPHEMDQEFDNALGFNILDHFLKFCAG